MTWYGGNDGGRETPWEVGDLVRYDSGPTALMRINHIRPMGDDPRGIACSIRYYGRAFHDEISHYENGEERASMGRYHGQCHEPTAEDIAAWEACHDENDSWIRGMWSPSSVLDSDRHSGLT